MKKKIAILTGCEGQLGSLFAKELIELNYHIVGVDIKKKSKNKNQQKKRRMKKFYGAFCALGARLNENSGIFFRKF